MALRRVKRDLGRPDYKDTKRVFLPIGNSGKGMGIFYRTNKNERLIENFKVLNI